MVKSYASLIEIKNEIKKGEITVEGLVRGYLKKISANAHFECI